MLLIPASEEGFAIGIGPIAGQRVRAVEKDYDTGALAVAGPDGSYGLSYEDGVVTVLPTAV